MILTGEQIKKAVEEGQLDISPFESKNLKGASYTFTLDPKLLIQRAGQTIRIDADIAHEEISIPKEGYLVEPGKFVLGCTREKLTLNGKFACQLSTRGSVAQMGLNVLLGSTFVEPDTNNQIVLEISNASHNNILLLPGMLIVKGIFLSLEETIT